MARTRANLSPYQRILQFIAQAGKDCAPTRKVHFVFKCSLCSIANIIETVHSEKKKKHNWEFETVRISNIHSEFPWIQLLD